MGKKVLHCRIQDYIVTFHAKCEHIRSLFVDTNWAHFSWIMWIRIEISKVQRLFSRFYIHRKMKCIWLIFDISRWRWGVFRILILWVLSVNDNFMWYLQHFPTLLKCPKIVGAEAPIAKYASEEKNYLKNQALPNFKQLVLCQFSKPNKNSLAINLS